MPPTNEQVAEAFSRHDFEATFPHLAEDVRWNLVGEKLVEGKDQVVALCTESAAYLAGVTTTFTRFRTVVGAGTVVVDSVAEYRGGEDGTTTVASCDLYDFSDGRLSEITSYTVPLTAGG